MVEMVAHKREVCGIRVYTKSYLMYIKSSNLCEFDSKNLMILE